MISRKRFIQLIFWGCIYCISITPFLTNAQNSTDPMNLPLLTNLVTDYSAVFDSTILSGLNNEAFIIQQQTSAEIASVLFPNRNGNELFDIGMRLFRESGIGSAEKNNGLLLLIATEEKKLRIIVGYGLEGLFPDIWISSLIETKIRPLVNDGQRQQAISIYHQSVLERLQTEPELAAMTNEQIILTIRDLLCFIVWGATTLYAFKSIRKKSTSPLRQSLPILPFIGLFGLLFLGLPGVIGAFFGYFFGLIFGSVQTPKSGRGNGQGISPRGGRSSGGGGMSGGFGGFGGGSSGGGGAGD